MRGSGVRLPQHPRAVAGGKKLCLVVPLVSFGAHCGLTGISRLWCVRDSRFALVAEW